MARWLALTPASLVSVLTETAPQDASSRPAAWLTQIEAARWGRDEPRSQLVLEDRQALAGRRGTGDPIAQPVDCASPQHVDRQPSVSQFARRHVHERGNAPRLEVHPDDSHRRLVLDDEAPAPNAHEPAIGEHCRRHRRIGIVQSNRCTQIDHQVSRRHRWNVQSPVLGDPAQAVKIVDESVERRGRDAANVFHSLIIADKPKAT